MRSARQELEAREDDLANYELGEHEGRVRSIEDQIAGLGDPMRLKQIEAAKMNSAVPHVGKWVYEQVGGGFLVATNWFAREGGAWRMIHHQAGPTSLTELPEEEDPASAAVH